MGEEFVVLHKVDNDYNCHTIVVHHILETSHVIVGHLPQEILRVTHHFSRHKGKIKGTVTGM